MKSKLKIEIIGNKASVFLLDEKRNVVSKLTWTDNRDLSEKLLRKIDLLLKKKKISLNNISQFAHFQFNFDYLSLQILLIVRWMF